VIESQEVELKLELDPADVERFRGLALLGGKSKRPLLQISTYYDTPEGDLRKAGFSLRLRRKGRRCVQTLKRKGESGGFSARAEWEQRIAGPDLDFAALEGTPAGKMLSKKKVRSRLEPVSETRVKRTVWQIRRPRSAIELILDEGEVASGGKGEPICEIELELKRGTRAMLFELAAEIAAEVPLRMGAMSKSERGFALVEGTSARVRKAEPVVLSAEMNVAESFAAIVQSCLRHFRLNEALVAHGRDGKALHQMRVAMRRLRSALALFKPAFAGEEQERLAAELRWFTVELGRARDLDVILGNRRGGNGGESPEAGRRDPAAEG
jgi:inorganic triphosphatase YgiF